MKTEEIAKVCHEANRAYCELLGDFSQVPWSDAPNWQRDTVIDGVKSAASRLLTGEEYSPKDSHDNWMRRKKQEGWTYGPVKDATKKEHPYMIPFDDMTKAQRIKDHMFLAIAICLLKNGMEELS